jgi:hypothetical protein
MMTVATMAATVKKQHVQHHLVDSGGQPETNGGLEQRIAVDRGADHAGAPPGAVACGGVGDRQRAQFRGTGREHTLGQRDRRLGHNRRTNQRCHDRTHQPLGLDECEHEICRQGEGQHRQEIDYETERHPECARKRPVRRPDRQPASDRRERPEREEMCDDAKPKRGQAADADSDPQRAPRGLAPLGLQPGHEPWNLFESIDDLHGDIPDRVGTLGNDVRGRRERILRRGTLSGPGVFLSGEQGPQTGEQLVASRRVFKRLDEAAQLRLVGDRIGWHLDRLPALDEGVRHLLSMSERGAQGQQQRNQAATSIDAPPHGRPTSGTKEEFGPWRSFQSTRSVRPPPPASRPT